MTTRSEVDINEALISGIDRLPSATWEGQPPLVLDPTTTDSTFSNFGELNYDRLREMATTHLERWSGPTGNLKYGGDPAPDGCRVFPVTEGSGGGCYFGPRYNTDGTCDTGHPLNFGAPSGPCADHFPIVRVSGDWAIRGELGGYAQGIFVMDTSAAGVGSEFDIEKGDPGAVVAGLIIGKGCVEVDDGMFYGAMFIDGSMIPHPSCTTDEPLFLHKDTGVQYSSCVLNAALGGLGTVRRRLRQRQRQRQRQRESRSRPRFSLLIVAVVVFVVVAIDTVRCDSPRAAPGNSRRLPEFARTTPAAGLSSRG